MPNYIRTLTVYYDTAINFHEIPLFRGAVINSLGDKANLLYHNHTGEGTFRYAYPLIQYKRLGGKAAIVCIDQAVDLIGQFLSQFSGTMSLGNRTVQCIINGIVPARILVQTWNSSFDYHVSNWIPLNSKNYVAFQQLTNDVEKVIMLEGILKGNLLSMLKGLGIHLDSELTLEISHLSKPRILYNKGIGMTAFNVDFRCNLSIPYHVGVGKNSSIGFGVVYPSNSKTENEKQ